MEVLGLSDYGRCAFGSGMLPLLPPHGVTRQL